MGVSKRSQAISNSENTHKRMKEIFTVNRLEIQYENVY